MPVTAEQRRPTKPAQRSGMPAKARQEFQRGIGTLIGGSLTFIAGVAAAVIIAQAPDSPGKTRVRFGLMLSGLIMFGYGCLALIRAQDYQTGRVSESGKAGIDRFTGTSVSCLS